MGNRGAHIHNRYRETALMPPLHCLLLCLGSCHCHLLIRVLHTPLRCPPTVGFINGGAHSDIPCVSPLHIQEGTVTDPAHVPLHSSLGKGVDLGPGKTNPVLPDGATGSVLNPVELPEECRTGVKVVHINVVTRSKVRHPN